MFRIISNHETTAADVILLPGMRRRAAANRSFNR